MSERQDNLDTIKFKSVAVRVTTYKMLKALATRDNRSVGMFITHLTEQEQKRQKRKKVV
jgi:predicted DNA-binding ribbon-helix-helix protein